MARLVIRDRFTGRRYELEVFPENTVDDVINALIDGRYISSAPGEGYEWILIDSRGVQIPPNARILNWISESGNENEVWLTARWKGGGHPG